MKKKVAEIITDILEENGIKHCFTLVGGGAMHLNDSFGNANNLKCIYCMHEQGAAIAAEGYARINNKMPVVCVTTGPGGTNALTGVLCAWQDNIPMLIISGQVKTSSMVKNTGLNLRQFGEQEYPIIDSVKPMTKFAETVENPCKIKYYLQKAIFLANTGRRGPCWIDIPLDVQGAYIEEYELEEFIPSREEMQFDGQKILSILKNSQRPVILAGNGIRTSGAYDDFLYLCKITGIPVLAAKSIADLLPVNFPTYYGNFGINGGWSGNFIVQNADCLLVLGCRLSFGEIGFNYRAFSPNSTKIVIEVDEAELKKDTVDIDMPVNIDLTDFFQWINKQEIKTNIDKQWIAYCDDLKSTFPIYQEKFYKSKKVNAYYFAQVLQNNMVDDAICVVGNSCSSVSIKQCGVAHPQQRMWGNVNCGTMGYDIPAAIGAAVASQKNVICCTGDGSFQLNIQELQTAINYHLPIKFFVFNNGGYRSIILSQSKNFGRFSGCTPESGLTLPSLKKISMAYDIPYFSCDKNEALNDVLPNVLQQEGCVICEIFEDENHAIEPKLGNKITPNGEIISPTLTDLLPPVDEVLYKKFIDFKGYKEIS